MYLFVLLIRKSNANLVLSYPGLSDSLKNNNNNNSFRNKFHKNKLICDKTFNPGYEYIALYIFSEEMTLFVPVQSRKYW